MTSITNLPTANLKWNIEYDIKLNVIRKITVSRWYTTARILRHRFVPKYQ